MGKLPAFQFYPNDWRTDPNLCRVGKSARDTWMDMLCMMFHCDERGFLVTAGKAWSDQEIAGSCRGPQDANHADIIELLAKGVAHRDNRGAIYSKRMVRDEETRRQTKDRVNKHRNGNVTQLKRSRTEDEVETVDAVFALDGGLGEEPPIDSDLTIKAILELHPRAIKNARTEHAIVDAMIRESKALGSPKFAADYLMGRTRIYRDCTDKWPPGERKFIKSADEWFANSKYMEDEQFWQRGTNEIPITKMKSAAQVMKERNE